jgi:hypothetical protein
MIVSIIVSLLILTMSLGEIKGQMSKLPIDIKYYMHKLRIILVLEISIINLKSFQL